MSAYANFNWNLGSSQTASGSHRRQPIPAQMALDSQDWMEAVRASSSRAAAQNTAAMAAGSNNLQAAASAQASVIGDGLTAQASAGNTALINAGNLAGTKMEAEALIEREKIRRDAMKPDSFDRVMQGLRFAGGAGIAAYALSRPVPVL